MSSKRAPGWALLTTVSDGLARDSRPGRLWIRVAGTGAAGRAVADHQQACAFGLGLSLEGMGPARQPGRPVQPQGGVAGGRGRQPEQHGQAGDRCDVLRFTVRPWRRLRPYRSAW